MMQAELESFRFWYPWRARYRDCDMQGIVYFSVYFEYVEQAIMEYFQQIGVPIGKTIHEGSFDWAFAHAEIDYRAPVAFDDLVSIGIRIPKRGRSSFEVHFAVVDAARERVHAHGRLVLVCYDSRSRRSCPLPDFVREKIEAFEGA
jgi:acyl-CoA thioester hydrolase